MNTFLGICGIILDFICLGLIITLIVNKFRKKNEGEK